MDAQLSISVEILSWYQNRNFLRKIANLLERSFKQHTHNF